MSAEKIAIVTGHTVVPYCYVQTDDRFFCDDSGVPVWPIRSNEELQSLIDISHLMGASCAELNFSEVRRGRSADPVGLVAVVVAEFVDEAALYAHLTNRAVRRFDSTDELINSGESPEVVVLSPNSLSVALMEYLYRGEQRDAPGLLLANSVEELHLQVLTKSVTASYCGESEGVGVQYYPLARFDQALTENTYLLGGDAPVEDVKLALDHGSPVLSLLTHSDGIDALAGDRLTLCSHVHRYRTNNRPQTLNTATYKLPRCIQTNWCHRTQMLVPGAMASNQLIGADGISARILYLDICNGLLLADSATDPGWGLALALVNSTSIGVVITNWSIVLKTSEDTAALHKKLQNGLAAGSACAGPEALNRLCILGDPRARALTNDESKMDCSPPENNVAAPREIFRRTLPVTSPSDALTFLLQLLPEHPEGASNLLTDQETIFTTRETLLRLRTEIPDPGDEESLRQDTERRVRVAFLESLRNRDTVLSKYWVAQSAWRELESQENRCPQCRALVDIHRLRPAGVSVIRHMVICPLCGITEDRPSGIDTRFCINRDRLNRGCIRVTGTRPQRNWDAVVHVGAAQPSDNIIITWPADPETGEPVASLLLPESLPAGQLRISVVLLAGSQIATFARFWRADSSTVEIIPAQQLDSADSC